MAKLRDIPLLEMNQLADARLLRIDFRAAYHAAVNVKALEVGLGMRNQKFLCLIEAAVPDLLRNQVLPGLTQKFAVHAGRHIGRHHRRLN